MVQHQLFHLSIEFKLEQMVVFVSANKQQCSPATPVTERVSVCSAVEGRAAHNTCHDETSQVC